MGNKKNKKSSRKTTLGQKVLNPKRSIHKSSTLQKRLHSRFCVEIFKSRGELKLFYDGHLIRTIPVKTGKNPADKIEEGDMATPEGEFYICYKNPRSRYVRFLGISYPNLEDASRGLHNGLITRVQFNQIRKAIENRLCPPWKTPLGGEVGLHGRTARAEWTHGCISMDNRNILEFSRMLPLGTPVEIFS